MVKDNRRQNWQTMENEENRESSSIGEKFEGKRLIFGMYRLGGRPPMLNGGTH